MALRGDEEIDSLLAMMGGGSGQEPATSTSTMPPKMLTSHQKPLKSSSADHQNKDKSKKRKKKRKNNKDGKTPAWHKQSKGNNVEKIMSFPDTRLSQNCFEWPSNNGKRWLYLGEGLLGNCEGYVCSGNEQDPSECYGSNMCQSCGASAAIHELRLSSSWYEGVDDAVRDLDPPSIVSLANIIVASRNARCLIGEFHATSNRHRPAMKMHEPSKNVPLPPLNSIATNYEAISEHLDIFVGRMLGCSRGMMRVLSKTADNHVGMREIQKGYDRKLMAPITTNDAQLVKEKISSLINAAKEYKEAMDIVCSPDKAPDKSASIDVVEKRLSVMAACDAVYYRCYYAAAVAYNTGEGSDIAAMIPHPPTYFSCPGLAWDVHGAGVESIRIFLGESSSNDNLRDLAAPLDESTRQLLLKSWGLKERLSSGITRAVAGDTSAHELPNAFLALWQSRFLETIRHVWATRYSAVKSSIALQDALKSTKNATGIPSLHNNTQESVLKIHETDALSPAVTQWRDSVRDYPAHFYAYAAPTNEALRAISTCFQSSETEQIVEAGAGTGFWSALLQSHLNCISNVPGDRRTSLTTNTKQLHSQIDSSAETARLAQTQPQRSDSRKEIVSAIDFVLNNPDFDTDDIESFRKGVVSLKDELVERSKKRQNNAQKKNAPEKSAVPLVVPYDISPPSQGNGSAATSNDYHGNIPTFMEVHQADTFSQALSASTAGRANTALLLCYPPPASDMAHEALSVHLSNGGRTVMHIGEWQGLTGDASFEKMLTHFFSCEEKDVIFLPAWGSDATYLTLWRKKRNEGVDNITCSPALGCCSAKQCPNRARRRCRYARCLQYCSSKCYENHYSQRRALLALHMIQITSTTDDVSYENDSHFMELSGIGASKMVLDKRPKKKRHKKKR
ncbi:hypothetical protein ACHAXR_013524 [Thalassiosira sp. AJA248-18]